MYEKRPDESLYYALETLEKIKNDIPGLANAMAARRTGVEKHKHSDIGKARDHYALLEKARNELVGNIVQSASCLFEIGEETLATYAGKLASQIKAFNLMTRDYGKLTSTLQNYAQRLPEHATASASNIGHLMNAVRMGHYPTDAGNIDYILKAVTFPQGVTTNLFDPCCGDGGALKRLAVGNNCFTYGVELDESRAEAAQDALHRVGFGSFFHSRISHDVFHLVLLNPPYLSVLTENGGKARNEKKFLIETISHIMIGGLLIYIIPHYRLTPDICRIFCDHFSGISVYRFTPDEFKKFGQVAVLGMRKARSDGSEEAAKLANLALSPESIPCLTEIEEGVYCLPAQAREVSLFHGAVFNERELARQLKKSKSFESLFASKELTSSTRHPPLPFSISQLGLIGGSGLINGLIECETPHIIKGRIVKEARSESEDNRDKAGNLISTEVKEKVSNKMIFNILTPDGYKALA